MLEFWRNAARPRYWRVALHRLRIFAGFAAGAVACSLLASSPPLPGASAQAQVLAEAKKKAEKKVEKKAPAPKDGQKDQQERAPFTVEDEEVAVIPGIADARDGGEHRRAHCAFRLPRSALR